MEEQRDAGYHSTYATLLAEVIIVDYLSFFYCVTLCKNGICYSSLVRSSVHRICALC